MTPMRWMLDLVAAGCLLVALAYYWTDNTVHEWIGTALFALVVLHNAFNRRWYGRDRAVRPATRGHIDWVATLSLLAAMLALLTTSVMISRSVFAFLGIDAGFSVRQVHFLVAYWSVILVAVHLGLRWPKVMQAGRNALRIDGRNALRTAVLRLAAAGIAVHGVQASFAMGVGSKLFLQMSLDGWNFETSAAGFFVNWLSVAGLYVVLTYYVLMWVQLRGRKAGLAISENRSTVCRK